MNAVSETNYVIPTSVSRSSDQNYVYEAPMRARDWQNMSCRVARIENKFEPVWEGSRAVPQCMGALEG